MSNFKHYAEQILESDSKQFISKAQKNKLDSLTINSETFTAGIGNLFKVSESDWISEEEVLKYRLNHQLDIPIENLDVNFYDEEKNHIKLDFKFIDNNNIDIFINNQVNILVTMDRVVKGVLDSSELDNYYNREEIDTKFEENKNVISDYGILEDLYPTTDVIFPQSFQESSFVYIYTNNISYLLEEIKFNAYLESVANKSYKNTSSNKKDFSNISLHDTGYSFTDFNYYIETNNIEWKNRLERNNYTNVHLKSRKDVNKKIVETQQLRGTTEAIKKYQGKQGQLIVNTDTNTVHVMDGVTASGTELAKKDDLNAIQQEVEDLKNSTPDEGLDLSNYLNKTNDKANLLDMKRNDDEKYVTPQILVSSIELLDREGMFNSVTSINGMIGEVNITRELLELDNVINEKQATKEEFDSHINNDFLHITKKEYEDLLKLVGEKNLEIDKKVDKTMKATIQQAEEGTNDTNYMTPLLAKKSLNKIINDAGGIEFANYILSINGRTAENILLTREDVELENLINERQATKEEFDNHVNDNNVHITPTEKENMMLKIGEIDLKDKKSLKKIEDKATIVETIEGTNDEKYATPRGLKALLDDMLSNTSKNLMVYELKDFGFDGIIAEVLEGQVYYSNKNIKINNLELSTEPTVAEKNIRINSNECKELDNTYLFIGGNL